MDWRRGLARPGLGSSDWGRPQNVLRRASVRVASAPQWQTGSTQRGGAVSGALLLISLAKARQHIGMQLEAGGQRQFAWRLFALTDGNYATCEPLGFLERTLGDANLHEAGKNRCSLGMLRANARLLEQEQSFEKWTRRVMSFRLNAMRARLFRLVRMSGCCARGGVR